MLNFLAFNTNQNKPSLVKNCVIFSKNTLVKMLIFAK